MSFYFDDDNDDHAFSQTFRSQGTPFSTKPNVVTQSQDNLASLLFPTSQSQLSFQSPLAKTSQQQQQQQYSLSQTPLHTTNNKTKNNDTSFVCQNCGAVDEYYRDEVEGGKVTCSHCFTQAQFHDIVEEFDYDDGQNMALRNRDGTLKTMKTASRRADGTSQRGRPPVPIEDLDRTRPPPSLEVCLSAFGSVLRKACKIMCLELMDVAIEDREDDSDSSSSRSTSDSDDDDDDDMYNRRNEIKRQRRKQQFQNRKKKEIYCAVSKTIKELWKAYLWSWKEGADQYSELYPQIRFCLRDAFLGVALRRTLYHTLSAKARSTLVQKVKQEVAAEEKAVSDDDDDDDDDDSENEEDFSEDNELFPSPKRFKVEHYKEEASGLGSLLDLFEKDNSDNNSDDDNDSSDKENTQLPKHKLDELPFPDVILSNACKTYFRSRPTVYNDDCAADNTISTNNHSHKTEEEEDEVGHTNDDNHHNDIFSVASDLSVLDGNPDTKPSLSSGRKKRKLISQKECAEAYTANNVIAKMLYYHHRRMTKPSNSKRDPKLGRKEAALLLRPSMVLVAGMLLVAAAPHGVTEGQMVAWIENGSLPLLRAFTTLVPENQREKLTMVTSFFSLPVAPSASTLHTIVKRLHVACGYQAPTVKLVAMPSTTTQPVTPCTRNKFRRPKTKERVLTSKSLYAPGRLVRPNTVPLLLGQLVSDLGFSQTVLNYSLALMGLPVSRQALLEQEDMTWMVEDVPQKKKRRWRPRTMPTAVTVVVPDEVAEDWDRAHVFDLSNPEDRRRRKKYLNRIYQRKYRAKKRGENGHVVDTRKRNTRYSLEGAAAAIAVDDEDDDFQTSPMRRHGTQQSEDESSYYSQSSSEEEEEHEYAREETTTRDEIPSFIERCDPCGKASQGECQERINEEYKSRMLQAMDARNHVPKRMKTWLPRALKGARIDKLGDVNRILAVVVVACKLIPNWDQNHRYIFSRGYIDNDKARSGVVKSMDRFVPWNREHFRFIGNGKAESDYLAFLEDVVFRRTSYALPKFVGSLKNTSNTNDGDDRSMSSSTADHLCKVEEPDHGMEVDEKGKNERDTIRTVVIPNETILGWNNLPSHSVTTHSAEGPSPKGKTKSLPQINQARYCLTTRADTRGLLTPDSALGPLIEYFAYKTEADPDIILKNLIKLDKEMRKKDKGTPSREPMAPAKLYKHAMINPKKEKKKIYKKKKTSRKISRCRPDSTTQDNMENIGLEDGSDHHRQTQIDDQGFSDEESVNTAELLTQHYAIGEEKCALDEEEHAVHQEEPYWNDLLAQQLQSPEINEYKVGQIEAV